MPARSSTGARSSWTIASAPDGRPRYVLVVGSTIWLLLFAHRHVDYAHELWWQFELRAERAARHARDDGGRDRRPRDRHLDAAPPAAARCPAAPIRDAIARARGHRRREPDTPWRTWRSSATSASSSRDGAPRPSSCTASRAGAGSRWAIPSAADTTPVELAWRFRELGDRHGGWPRLLPGAGAQPPALRRPRPHAPEARRGGARAPCRLHARRRRAQVTSPDASGALDARRLARSRRPGRPKWRPCWTSCGASRTPGSPRSTRARRASRSASFDPTISSASPQPSCARHGDDRRLRQRLARRRQGASCRSTSCATARRRRAA